MQNNAYQQLLQLSKKAALFDSIESVLGWDKETYMPEEGIALRAEQAELLTQLSHELLTSKAFGDALHKLIDIESGEFLDASLDAVQRATLQQWRRDYRRAVKLPPSFVSEFSHITSQGTHVWAQAKKRNDFALFKPYLEKILYLCRKKIDLIGYTDHPYDALLDDYEPGMRTAKLITLFNKLKQGLLNLYQEVKHTSHEMQASFLNQDFPPDKQMEVGKFLLKAMNVPALRSRLDLSTHPFSCGIHPYDTRLTTRIFPNELLENISSVMHEAGHGLYSLGRPVEQFGTPLCQSISYGVDESQSRMWETIVGHSLPFWKFFFPTLQAIFPKQLGKVSLNDFYKAVNQVQAKYIRVNSDEVTYNFHILLRFEIELSLLTGSLKLDDLREAWNAKMQTYLGIIPPTDALGCLQDIHWSMGAFGYFPTYTLGNLYAAQFFQAFTKQYPAWKEEFVKGNLPLLATWLKENIHKYGRLYTADEIAKRVTGSTLDENHFLSYLEQKYRSLSLVA